MVPERPPGTKADATPEMPVFDFVTCNTHVTVTAQGGPIYWFHVDECVADDALEPETVQRLKEELGGFGPGKVCVGGAVAGEKWNLVTLKSDEVLSDFVSSA